VKSSKLQAPSSKEAPNPKLQSQNWEQAAIVDVWTLGFPWSLELGAWDFFRRATRIRPEVRNTRGESGSTFVIVLWIAFGLVSMALYFGNSMSSELRASDHRVSGVAAEQAIEGAARYINYILANQPTNGFLPDLTTYVSQAGRIGDAHYWLIGRDTNSTLNGAPPTEITFGLIDEGSKLNLNTASSNMLVSLMQTLPRANADLATAILDWRDTNGGTMYQTYYATRPQPYQSKNGPFESIDELRLLYGGDTDTLVGEDINRNGILDPNETDSNHNGQLEPGALEYVTVYSREPNTYSNGTARVSLRNVAANGPLRQLLQGALDSTKATRVMNRLFPQNNAGNSPTSTRSFDSLLDFVIAAGDSLSRDDFPKIADALTTVATTNAYINGRINVNTASAEVLACLPGISDTPDLAQTLVTYRQTNPDKLGSIAWVADALSQNNSVLSALRTNDCITVRSYQFTADIAALGPNGRGYHRTRFIFDTADGFPKIVYRQDLTHLGWALGKQIRQQVRQDSFAKATQ
jgi:DNA uptake protein ComE-like DNA-binding protein